ncbi:hypothetical protein Hanom_Chr17g01583661 [Helianthus anomalus]
MMMAAEWRWSDRWLGSISDLGSGHGSRFGSTRFRLGFRSKTSQWSTARSTSSASGQH